MLGREVGARWSVATENVRKTMCFGHYCQTYVQNVRKRCLNNTLNVAKNA